MNFQSRNITKYHQSKGVGLWGKRELENRVINLIVGFLVKEVKELNFLLLLYCS
jgi:hypothetical protein